MNVSGWPLSVAEGVFVKPFVRRTMKSLFEPPAGTVYDLLSCVVPGDVWYMERGSVSRIEGDVVAAGAGDALMFASSPSSDEV